MKAMKAKAAMKAMKAKAAMRAMKAKAVDAASPRSISTAASENSEASEDNCSTDQDRAAESAAHQDEDHLLVTGATLGTLARFLQTSRREGVSWDDDGEGLEGYLAEILDTSLQAEHAWSEKLRPAPAEVLRSVRSQSRALIIGWMAGAFDRLALGDYIHGVTLTIDRYFAACSQPIEESSLQLVLLAALATEMKMWDGPGLTTKQRKNLLLHLGHNRQTWQTIRKAEHKLLSKLGFVAGAPTPFSFLRILGLRFKESGHASAPAVFSLAAFILELALLDPALEYQYPHSALAAGALSGAFRALSIPSRWRDALLDDVLAYRWETGGVGADAKSLVRNCEEALLMHWMRCSTGVGDWVEFYPPMLQKYSGLERHYVAIRANPTLALEFLYQEAPDLLSESQRAIAKLPAGTGSDCEVIKNVSI
jgi:hypothetical protein